jgi:uncharacterized protein YhaN
MRLRELHLQAIGPFTGLSLDLSQGQKGLHVIYGPNEAGKSSALRSLSYLLFGFPAQLGDDFVHPYNLLRVGARLSNDNGDELEFLRRKANKHSLRALDDSTVVDEKELQRFLGHIDETIFSKFFGIDHPALVEGGRSIAEGKGDVGETLFAASGVSRLHGVLATLQTEADELFLPSAHAKKPLINDLLRKLDMARTAIRKSQLPAQHWEDHRRALEKAQTRKQEAETELQELSTERNRLERIKKALPLIAARIDLLASREELASVRILPDDFSDRRLAFEQDLRLGETEQSRASQAIHQLNEQIKDLDVPTALLDQRGVVEPMANRLGVYQQAQDDRPDLEVRLHQLDNDAKDTLRRIDQSLQLSAADSLQLPESDRTHIRTLGTRYDGLVSQVDHWNDTVSNIEQELEKSRKELATVPTSPDATSLQAAVKAAARLGDIEDNLATARQDFQNSKSDVAVEIKKLSLWTGSADELEQLAVPATETLERYEEELAAIDQRLRDPQRDIANCEADAANLDTKIQQLHCGETIPSEAGLREARDRRDVGWKLVRRAWREHRESADENRAFLEALGGSDTDLADAFERAVRAADEAADRLRREADRVATLAQLQAQHDQRHQQIARLNELLSEARANRRDVTEQWTKLWQMIGIEPLSPREMLAWAVRQADLAEQIRLLRQSANEVKQLETKLHQNAEPLKAAIEHATGQPTATDASFSQLLTQGQAVLGSMAENVSRRKELVRDSERLANDLANAERRASQAQSSLEMWNAEWKEATKSLPLKPSHGPAEANALLDLINNLSQQIKQADELRQRIQQIDEAANDFQESTRTLTQQLAPELSDIPADQSAAQLYARLQKGITAAEKLDLLTKQRSEEERNLAAAKSTVDTVGSQLAALCKEAGCSVPEELLDTESRSAQRQQIDDEIDQFESQLRQLSAGQPLNGFIDEARLIDGDTLEPRLQQLDQQINELNRQLKDELGETIGAERTILAQMGTASDAAQTAEEAHDLVARIASNAEDYARLKLSLVVLKKAIERYREKHQGPVLQRASEIFSVLTVGSFAALRDDYDHDGNPQLVGIRQESGEPVQIANMSDGTADQLYLSVRLSWLENYFSKHETIPFIVDDILPRFDDERAGATLKALGELSNHTQVLFFTHHRHLVNLAESMLDSDVLFIHELPRYPALPIES